VDPIELEFTVACSAERAFSLWATETSRWWPRDHSVSGDAGSTVTFEPRAGGRIYERTTAGDEHEWGEVLAWEPPHRLTYLWHLAAPRDDATEVEVTFSEAENSTVVTIVHRGWERLGAEGAERRERNRRGWGGVIPDYQSACVADSQAPARDD
jgi:uncharacterized protein YndB with AHSA1/START domain